MLRIRARLGTPAQKEEKDREITRMEVGSRTITRLDIGNLSFWIAVGCWITHRTGDGRIKKSKER